MHRLEVSGAVRPIYGSYGSLGVKRLTATIHRSWRVYFTFTFYYFWQPTKVCHCFHFPKPP